MGLYRKKPVVIEAIQWDGFNHDEIKRFAKEFATLEQMSNGESVIVITTLESNKELQTRHAASVNDWVIKGVQGEYYFCKPDIFEATYEEVK